MLPLLDLAWILLVVVGVIIFALVNLGKARRRKSRRTASDGYVPIIGDPTDWGGSVDVGGGLDGGGGSEGDG